MSIFFSTFTGRGDPEPPHASSSFRTGSPRRHSYASSTIMTFETPEKKLLQAIRRQIDSPRPGAMTISSAPHHHKSCIPQSRYELFTLRARGRIIGFKDALNVARVPTFIVLVALVGGQDVPDNIVYSMRLGNSERTQEFPGFVSFAHRRAHRGKIGLNVARQECPGF